ncbi:hypothetical protein [Phenylobacterium sp.]|uniref:hypothetical protein n=1 Tax=Phenylobacterium sp. TaxID=1871053 RepID=UPI003983D9B6
MASQFRRRTFPYRAAKPAPRPLSIPPVPGSVVDAVLRFHDRAIDQGGGRTLLSLSDQRLHDAEVEAALGELTNRAARVSILWNDREDEIIRVLEGAETRLAA